MILITLNEINDKDIKIEIKKNFKKYLYNLNILFENNFNKDIHD